MNYKQVEKNLAKEKTLVLILSESGKEIGKKYLSIHKRVGDVFQFQHRKVGILRIEKPSLVDDNYRVWIYHR